MSESFIYSSLTLPPSSPIPLGSPTLPPKFMISSESVYHCLYLHVPTADKI